MTFIEKLSDFIGDFKDEIQS